MKKKFRTRRELLEEIQSLRGSLDEAGETLRAIQSGEVDALVVSTSEGEQVFTLKGAEQSYRIMVESMSEGAISLDARGTIMYSNLRFAAMIKKPLEQVLGTSIYGYVAPIDKDRFKSLLEQGFKGKNSKAELAFQAADLTTIPVLLSVGTLQPDSGLIGVVAADLTEQKRNEEIIASERLAGLIFEQAAEALIVCNSEGTIVRAGREAQSLAEEDLFRANFNEVFRLKHAGGKDYLNLDRVLCGNAFRKEEFLQERKNGTTRDLLVSAGPLTRQDAIIGCVVIMVDITERKRAETELHKRTAQLEEANREMEAFTYSVSHDLQGPLRAMDGFTRMILKDFGDGMEPELRRRFEVIRENTQMMGKLIEGLLALSRIGRKDISFTRIDMEKLFKKTWQEIEVFNPGRKIDFRAGDLPPARGDTGLIRQVVYNLLSNAAKFTRRRETAVIEVGSIPEKDSRIYFVKDNGAGFDMEYYNKLFGVFQRLHRSADFEGTGIGLAIVNRIVRRHNGRVWAEGEVDKGAAFYFSLPMKRP
jgi:PAS domain S-box-containing protein